MRRQNLAYDPAKGQNAMSPLGYKCLAPLHQTVTSSDDPDVPHCRTGGPRAPLDPVLGGVLHDSKPST